MPDEIKEETEKTSADWVNNIFLEEFQTEENNSQ